ncbi:MAG: UbiA family prenyltransferase [Thermoproteota archaeon]
MGPVENTISRGVNRLKALQMLLRFHEYGPAFTLAGLFGSLFTFEQLELKTVWLVFFIASSSALAFVVNDISDRYVDSHSESPRNPISLGLITVKFASIVATVLLTASMLSLILLPANLTPVGLVVIFIAFTYSYGIRAKAKPPLDVLYHSIGPGLYVAMGYMTYRNLDSTGLILAIIAMLFSAVAELIQEVRDYAKDLKSAGKATVALLGEKPSLMLANIIMATALILIVALGITDRRFYWVLPLTPLASLLMHPMVRSLKEEGYRTRLPYELNRRGVVVALIVLLVFLAVRLLGLSA